MIIDTSAIMAVLNDEPEAPTFAEAMRTADELRMAAPTALELAIVARPGRFEHVMTMLRSAGVQVVDFTSEHFLLAQEAHMRFGRGSGSQARLNFGDCFSYALAKALDQPLLFKGDDFRHTDIVSAL